MPGKEPSKKEPRFRSFLYDGGKYHYLGSFKTKEEADSAHMKRLRELLAVHPMDKSLLRKLAKQHAKQRRITSNTDTSVTDRDTLNTVNDSVAFEYPELHRLGALLFSTDDTEFYKHFPGLVGEGVMQKEVKASPTPTLIFRPTY